jgi:hypothetical protein
MKKKKKSRPWWRQTRRILSTWSQIRGPYFKQYRRRSFTPTRSLLTRRWTSTRYLALHALTATARAFRAQAQHGTCHPNTRGYLPRYVISAQMVLVASPVSMCLGQICSIGSQLPRDFRGGSTARKMTGGKRCGPPHRFADCRGRRWHAATSRHSRPV